MIKWIFRRKLHHVLFWIAYFVFWTIYTTSYYHSKPLIAFAVTSIFFVGQAGTAYTTAYFLMPRFFNTRRYVLFAVLTVITWLIGSLFITTAFIAFMQAIFPTSRFTFREIFPNMLMGNGYMLFLFMAIKTIKEKLTRTNREQLLEKEKTENELRFLKSQMNPHFLFNAINSIYILIRKDSEMAASTLARFADMLRYQLYECNTDRIPIEKEVAYLSNYIEMERLRKGNTVITAFNVDEEVQHFSIAPLLIIPFVENAFKYVSAFPDKQNSVNIFLNYKDPIFECRVENTIDENAMDAVDRSYGGIGLENVKRRLELIYNGRHVLQIDSSNNAYKVSLSIQTQ